MTRALLEALGGKGDRSITHALNYAIGGLQFGIGKGGGSTIDADVEAVFRALELLARRDEWELAPFVATWNEPQRQHDPFAGRRLKDAIDRALMSGFDHGLDDTVRAIVAGEEPPYELAQARMLDALREIVWLDDPARVSYLSPVVEASDSSESFRIATLNYDNAVELAAKEIGIDLEQGFEIGETSATPRFPGNGLRLYKLHGSIDWEEQRTSLENGFGIETVEILRHADPRAVEWSFYRGYEPGLVFGAGNKLTMEGPFVDLLAHFRADLLDSDRLTVIGYSFRDTHVNYVLGQWLAANAERELRIVDPSWTDHGVWDEQDRFRSGLRSLARSRPENVKVFPMKASEALPQLWS
ncbi:MAG TPA: SIR2 family protein [Acidimicrobiia bacterium]|nr:SIR2 family protein [Acidimicrobiia bacterium]